MHTRLNRRFPALLLVWLLYVWFGAQAAAGTCEVAVTVIADSSKSLSNQKSLGDFGAALEAVENAIAARIQGSQISTTRYSFDSDTRLESSESTSKQFSAYRPLFVGEHTDLSAAFGLLDSLTEDSREKPAESTKESEKSLGAATPIRLNVYLIISDFDHDPGTKDYDAETNWRQFSERLRSATFGRLHDPEKNLLILARVRPATENSSNATSEKESEGPLWWQQTIEEQFQVVFGLNTVKLEPTKNDLAKRIREKMAPIRIRLSKPSSPGKVMIYAENTNPCIPYENESILVKSLRPPFAESPEVEKKVLPIVGAFQSNEEALREIFLRDEVRLVSESDGLSLANNFLPNSDDLTPRPFPLGTAFSIYPFAFLIDSERVVVSISSKFRMSGKAELRVVSMRGKPISDCRIQLFSDRDAKMLNEISWDISADDARDLKETKRFRVHSCQDGAVTAPISFVELKSWHRDHISYALPSLLLALLLAILDAKLFGRTRIPELAFDAAIPVLILGGLILPVPEVALTAPDGATTWFNMIRGFLSPLVGLPGMISMLSAFLFVAACLAGASWLLGFLFRLWSFFRLWRFGPSEVSSPSYLSTLGNIALVSSLAFVFVAVIARACVGHLEEQSRAIDLEIEKHLGLNAVESGHFDPSPPSPLYARAIAIRETKRWQANDFSRVFTIWLENLAAWNGPSLAPDEAQSSVSVEGARN